MISTQSGGIIWKTYQTGVPRRRRLGANILELERRGRLPRSGQHEYAEWSATKETYLGACDVLEVVGVFETQLDMKLRHFHRCGVVERTENERRKDEVDGLTRSTKAVVPSDSHQSR